MRQCNSLLVFCEDDRDEMHRRQEDINQHFGCGFADLAAMHWLPRLGDDNALMTFDANGRAHCTGLFDQCLAAAKDHNATLIVFDTLADIFSGNENDRGHARQFAQAALGRLAREIEGAVLAHPSRNGQNSGSGQSGSTAWIGTFRSQLYLETPKPEDGVEPDESLRVLTRKKSNAARRGETIELQWRDGVLVPVREHAGIIGWIERRTAELVFFELLNKTTAEGQRVSWKPNAGNYAPTLFSIRPDREGFRKADFKRAMQVLFARRVIGVGSYKDAKKREQDCIFASPTRRPRSPRSPSTA